MNSPSARVLEGDRGEYTCRTDVSDVNVPGTLQAAIAARIDRLDADAKKTLNAAAVIGSRFSADMLEALGSTPFRGSGPRRVVDQVRFTPYAEYAFHNPLVRTVAYESQLKSDRAQLHRRVADTIESRDPSFGRRKRRAARRASGGRGRFAWRLRVAHACRGVVGHS